MVPYRARSRLRWRDESQEDKFEAKKRGEMVPMVPFLHCRHRSEGEKPSSNSMDLDSSLTDLFDSLSSPSLDLHRYKSERPELHRFPLALSDEAPK